MAGRLEIVTMTRAQLDVALDWAAREGWNPGLHDADAFFAADPGGFLMGLLDGEPVGCISAVRYDSGFAFLGFYIVVPQWRGHGYGLQLWRAAMARLGSRSSGLDGVLEQESNYRRSGFELACHNVRYEWRVRPAPPAAPSSLVSMHAAAFAKLEHYDRLCFPARRRAFLKAWLALPGGRTLACVDSGRLRGYGVIRRCRTGWKVGPLFADTRVNAELLLLELSREAGAEESVFLDVPDVNAAAMRLASDYAMQPVFSTARMYNRTPPAVDVKRIFGVTTFELG